MREETRHEKNRKTYGICPQGSACGVNEGVSACYCDNATDSFCPPESGCPSDPDCDIPPEFLKIVKPAAGMVYFLLLNAIWQAKVLWPEAYACPGIDAENRILVNCNMDALGGMLVTGDGGYAGPGMNFFDDVKVANGPTFHYESGTGEQIRTSFSDNIYTLDYEIDEFTDELEINYDCRYGLDRYYMNAEVAADTKGTLNDCSDDTYSITIQDSSFLEFSTECSDIKINSASLAMNAIDKLPNSGTVMTEIRVGTEFTAATLTFDASTPSTCQVQVTIGGVTRAVTIPGICS
ncbi:MAG: hypothetical protein ABIJ56_05985 [Pseudomonadota bacterium]